VHNSKTNQQSVQDLVAGYTAQNIPVGGINIDSTWATQFNNFEVNTLKFPDFSGLITDLHAKGIHVTLW